MKLDIQRKKEETKELEQEIVAHENLIKFREKAISKIKEID